VYIAKKVMTVNGEQRFPGDPVPEAAEWLRVESYLRAGWIVKAKDAPEPAKKAEPKLEPKPEPVAVEPKPVKTAVEKPAPVAAKKAAPKSRPKA
jgi:hypothetical protein